MKADFSLVRTCQFWRIQKNSSTKNMKIEQQNKVLALNTAGKGNGAPGAPEQEGPLTFSGTVGNVWFHPFDNIPDLPKFLQISFSKPAPNQVMIDYYGSGQPALLQIVVTAEIN